MKNPFTTGPMLSTADQLRGDLDRHDAWVEIHGDTRWEARLWFSPLRELPWTVSVWRKPVAAGPMYSGDYTLLQRYSTHEEAVRVFLVAIPLAQLTQL